ncbi:DNA-directed primase/polymerase protein-like [Sipha flava]|uniref:DNA-directed primase/polymerase protein n=1 Tax=Sipha flava TaxID=143950 RepID=A0A8B8GJM5_9HEMI|nr:DNA-directed primase/polymerase protein-like [Sipha flava]
MSGVTTNIFYGPSKRCDFESAMSSSTSRKKVRREPCHLTNVNRLLGPPIGWKNFPRQQEALDYAKEKSCGCMSFTYEQSNGQRYFMVAHPETFWYYDSRKPQYERHTYEIITEGHPCKLYFDLEYDCKENPESNGTKMLETFVKVIILFVRQRFDVLCSQEDVLDLDSSTSEKFSHHLVFPTLVFSNNIEAGYFVKFVCTEIDKFLSEDHNPEDNGRFYGGISTSDLLDLKTDKGLFCDQSVYSRNRHFRLFMSSKLKKNVPLLLSKTNKYQLSEKAHCDDCFNKQIFLNSLITFGCEGKVLLNFTNITSQISSQLGNKYTQSDNKSECYTSYTNTPFPRIDRFISDLVFPGKIFRNYYFPSVNKLVYSIVKNRYCGNIKRQHKNNNVKYVVDLNEMYWYQKCYDPDCHQYRSNGTKLPDEICFEYTNRIVDDLSDSQLVEVVDAALLTYEL